MRPHVTVRLTEQPRVEELATGEVEAVQGEEAEVVAVDAIETST